VICRRLRAIFRKILPDPLNLIGVPAQSSKVASYAVVGIVAPHHRSQMGVLVESRRLAWSPEAKQISDRGCVPERLMPDS
jgi:hypothetical protein